MQNNFGAFPAIWVVAILCLWIPSPGYALKCHVCNSMFNESCEVVADQRYVVDCLMVNDDPIKNHTICRKEVFSVSSPAFDMQSSRTVRSCGYEKHPRLSCFYNSNHDLKETICECVEDACNGGSFLRSAIQVLVSTLFSSYFVSFVIKS